MIVSEQPKKKNGGGWNKGKKGKKATNEVIEQRVDLIADYLRENPLSTRGKIHKRFCGKFKLHWVTVDRYVIRARNILRKQANVKLEDGRVMGLGVLYNLLNDKNHGIRVKAETRMADILGYNAPTQTRIGSPDGSPLPATIINPTIQFIVGEPKKAMEDALEMNGSGKRL